MPEFSAVPKLSRLQQILLAGRQHWDHDGYDPNARYRFLRALQCKTSALGGRIYASENEQQEFFNTCKSPACPSCGHWATIQWQRERWRALPEAPYKGITLTMPNTLWPLFAANPRLSRKLPEIAARVIGSYARVRKGVEVGVIAVLHTFNGKLEFNSHVHALVTGRDLQTAGLQRRSSIFFDPYELRSRWQRLVIVLLRGALEAGQLKSEMARDEVERLFQREEKRTWRKVHVQAFEGKEHFLRYAGRYVRRPPIAQRRILGIAEGFVWFWHKDKRDHRRKTVRCKVEEFIDRWAQHIPKRYQHAVRHFGLLAPRRWAQTAAAVFTITGTKQRPRPKRRRWAVTIQQQFGRNPLLDHKGQQMKWVRHLAPAVA
jgi:hypothetical protein